MTILCIIFGLLCAAAVIYMVLYRRQVKNTCRQLSYINENDTNMILTSDNSAKEFIGLISEINRMVELNRRKLLESEKNDKVLKQTITSLSHDIRTPLTSLDGYFQLLDEAETEEERRHYMDIIYQRIESLKMLLEQLFLFAKLQDSDYAPEPEVCRADSIAANVMLSFYEDFKRLEIEPSVEISEKPLCITANKNALIRVLQNVIKNALEHGEKHFILSAEEKDGRAEITVKNRIAAPEDVEPEQIFTRFYKADKARSHASTGLGLSIAKELVEKTGGEISGGISGDVFYIKIRYKLNGLSQTRADRGEGTHAAE